MLGPRVGRECDLHTLSIVPFQSRFGFFFNSGKSNFPIRETRVLYLLCTWEAMLCIITSTYQDSQHGDNGPSANISIILRTIYLKIFLTGCRIRTLVSTGWSVPKNNCFTSMAGGERAAHSVNKATLHQTRLLVSQLLVCYTGNFLHISTTKWTQVYKPPHTQPLSETKKKTNNLLKYYVTFSSSLLELGALRHHWPKTIQFPLIWTWAVQCSLSRWLNSSGANVGLALTTCKWQARTRQIKNPALQSQYFSVLKKITYRTLITYKTLFSCLFWEYFLHFVNNITDTKF